MLTETLVNKTPVLTNEERQIIKTILYFDVFSYPLNSEELYSHHNFQLTFPEFKLLLSELVNKAVLDSSGDFYFTKGLDPAMVVRRQTANKAAAGMMPEAVKWSKRINRFPFVRSVNLSGSIAKNYFDANSDIDYFIITKTNRLWICRTFIILYWKLLSKKNQKKMCTNYFVDETALELPDKNLFTATELEYLVPVINPELTDQLLNSNAWTKKIISDKQLNKKFVVDNAGKGLLRPVFEFLLDNAMGNALDNLFLRMTIKRWRKKFPDMQEEDFELQFRSRKNVCKRHTKGFQNKVLKLYEEKLKQFELNHKIVLQ